MNGIGMMLRSMGLDPEKIEKAIELVTGQINVAMAEIERQGKLLDRIAASLNINGDANQPKENEENENEQLCIDGICRVSNPSNPDRSAQSRFIE